MRRIATLSVLALAASFSTAFAAEEVKGPWSGLGVGSFVHQKTTSTMSGPNLPAMPPQTSETKQTLVKVTDEAWVIKSEMKMGEEWQGTEIPFPRKAQAGGTDDKGPKPEDLGSEKVTVDGTSIDCKKMKMTVEGSTTVSWTNDKYGLVKSESTGPGTTITTALTKLSGKTKVGSVEVEYREMTTSTKASGTEMKGTTWMSDAVPGGVVRSEMATDMPGGMKSVAVTETVAFEKK